MENVMWVIVFNSFAVGWCASQIVYFWEHPKYRNIGIVTGAINLACLWMNLS